MARFFVTRALLRFALTLAAAAVLLPALATGLVARAVANAPNRLRPNLGPSPPPDSLAEFHAYELRAPVSSPSAILSAWVLEPPSGPPRATIVVLHGVRLDKTSMLPMGCVFARAGYRTLMLDLRGHGTSTGDHLTYGVVDSRDVSRVLDELRAQGTDLGPVGAHGFSYGAATALQLSADDARVRAVVSVASFSSLREVVRDYLHWQAPTLAVGVAQPWLDYGIDLGGRIASFDPDAACPARSAARSHASVLLLHGSDDAQIPIHHAREISEAARGRAQLRVLPGETHASILADSKGEVARAALEWFATHL